MYSRTDQYRRRAIQARQQATQAIDPSLKADFENAADHWIALAEQVEWLEARRRRIGGKKDRAAELK
jgi:hypothetical protein